MAFDTERGKVTCDACGFVLLERQPDGTSVLHREMHKPVSRYRAVGTADLPDGVLSITMRPDICNRDRCKDAIESDPTWLKTTSRKTEQEPV